MKKMSKSKSTKKAVLMISSLFPRGNKKAGMATQFEEKIKHGLTIGEFREWFKDLRPIDKVAVIHFTSFRYKN